MRTQPGMLGTPNPTIKKEKEKKKTIKMTMLQTALGVCGRAVVEVGSLDSPRCLVIRVLLFSWYFFRPPSHGWDSGGIRRCRVWSGAGQLYPPQGRWGHKPKGRSDLGLMLCWPARRFSWALVLGGGGGGGEEWV